MIRTTSHAVPLPKLATGIAGFDALSRGGLPRQRTSLFVGGPGAGKTVFALQCMINAAREPGGAGIFVAFEESRRQIVANAATFDWGLAKLAERKLFVVDAHLSPTLVKAGDFDLAGMLAMLAAKQRQLGAQWIVFDGIDVLLGLLHDPLAEMRELYRLRDWLAQSGMTAIMTAKLASRAAEDVRYGFLQFMVDCVVRFEQRREGRVSARSLHITKYRGSDYAAAEFPVSFTASGIEVGAANPAEIRREAPGERVSAGFKRLDLLLGGGVYRASSTLISGVPGTCKTTLAAKFAEAACQRGEQTLLVSYDEAAGEIIRNMSSVGIDLRAHCRSGVLAMRSVRTEAVGAEEQLLTLRALIREHRPRCLVIDPLSAIGKSGGAQAAGTVASRLIGAAKDEGITLVVTALTLADDPRTEATGLEISTIADTWIHLSYLVRGGERNRALTVIKSRGTAHSNQVRELVLSKAGPALTDVYSSGGEVLMGTLRWEKEAEESARKARQRAEFDHRRRELLSAEARTVAQINALQADLQRQRAEMALYADENEVRKASSSERESELLQRRGADPAPLHSRKSGNGAAK